MKFPIIAILVLASLGPGFAQDVEVAPKVINYQVKLTDATNQPLGGEAGGTFGLRFAIFPQATGGNAVWAEERDVVVIGGVFNVALGGAGGTPVDAIPNDLGIAFEAKDRFLETTIVSGPGIAAEQTLAPRQQLQSVPFSLVAQEAQEAQVAQRAVVATLSESLIPELAKALTPPGAIIAYGGSVGSDTGGLMEPVPGYLLCNGAVINGTTENGKYTALKSALGNAWGSAGDSNADTVNLPDLRGVFLRGWTGTATGSYIDPDRNSRIARLAGGNAGNAVGSYQMDELKSHDHSLPYKQVPRPGGGSEPTPYPGADHRTGYAGGNETRGKNAYVAYLIKY